MLRVVDHLWIALIAVKSVPLIRVAKQGEPVPNRLSGNQLGTLMPFRVGASINNLIEQDHRAIKRRCASMGGFKSFGSAIITLAGIELAHRIRKRQFSLRLPVCN